MNFLKNENNNERFITSKNLQNVNEKWPLTTKIKCWHCTYPFNCIPWGIPKEYNSLRKKYILYGNFCSINCTRAYIYDHHQIDANKHDEWLMQLALEWFPEKFDENNNKINTFLDMHIAPPISELKIFGGKQDINFFRFSKRNTNNNNQLKLEDAHFCPYQVGRLIYVDDIKEQIPRRNNKTDPIELSSGNCNFVEAKEIKRRSKKFNKKLKNLF